MIQFSGRRGRRVSFVCMACTCLVAGMPLTLQAASRPRGAEAQSARVKQKKPETIRVVGHNTGYTAPDVTVWGKVPVPLKDVPQSVSVMTRQRMDDQNLITMTDVLEQVTGVTIQPNDTTNSQYYSRGYSLNSTTDGTPAYADLGSGSTAFDNAIFDRIEVLRGSAGLLQGSGSLGGTVNLVTKKPGQDFAVSGAATVGSWDNYRGDIDLSVSLNRSKTLRFRTVGAFQDQDFFYDHSHSRKWLAYGALEYDLSPRTTFLVSHAAQHQQVSGNYTGQPTYTDGSLIEGWRSLNTTPPWAQTTWLTQQTLASVTQKLFRNWTLTAKTTIRDQGNHLHDVFALSGLAPGSDLVKLSGNRNIQTDQTWRQADLYLQGSEKFLGLDQNFLFGFNYGDVDEVELFARRRQTYANVSVHNLGAVPDVPTPYTSGQENRTIQTGFYGQMRLQPVRHVFLILGGRVSSFQNKSRNLAPSAPTVWQNGATAHAQLTPYLGAVYDVTRHVSLYASYASIFIPQNNFSVSGAPLPAETGNQVEAGVKGAWYDGRLNAYAAVFRMKDNHRALADLNYPDQDFYVPSGIITTKGWEAEISGQVVRGWQMTAGYTYVQMHYANPEDSNFGNNVTPKHNFKFWSSYTVQGGRMKGLGLGVGLNAQSRFRGPNFYLNGVESGPNWQSSYVTLNALVSYRFSRHYLLQLNAKNLTDRVYYERLGQMNTYNTPAAPRNFMATLRGNF